MSETSEQEQETDDEEFPGKLLHQAALWDNSELLGDLLNGDQVQFIDYVDTEGRTALHAAATHNSAQCMKILLDAGANPNIRCGPKEGSKTPLHLAAERGNMDMVQLLVLAKADMAIRDNLGNTPLDLTEQSGNEQVGVFLKDSAGREERKKLLQLQSSLFDACTKGDTTEMRCLMRELGRDAVDIINSIRNGSNTLLYRASQDGNEEVVDLLLYAGADGRVHPVTGYSPLYIAAYNGHKRIVEKLLKKFPGLATVQTVENWLPLHAVAMNDHVEVQDTLLKFPYPGYMWQMIHHHSGAWEYRYPFDVNSQDHNQQSALYIACDLGHYQIVDKLLQLKVKAWKIVDKEEDSTADGSSDDSQNPNLKRSSKITDFKEMEKDDCVLCPVNIDQYCSGGETALHVAVRNGYRDIVRLLLDNDADVNMSIKTEDFECSPLVECCRNKDLEMAKLLIANGCHDAQNLAVAMAVSQQQDEMLALLLKQKCHADPDYKILKKGKEFHPSAKAGRKSKKKSFIHIPIIPNTPVMINWHKLMALNFISDAWILDAAYLHNQHLTPSPSNHPNALLAITRIDVSGNCIVHLPVCLFQLQSLRILNAAQNKIETLPAEDYLPLSKTRGNFAEQEWNCPILEEVYLQDNRIENLPDAIFQIPSLAILDVSNNKLQELTFKMWSAPKLKEINLSFNLLQWLPTGTRSSRNLTQRSDVKQALAMKTSSSSASGPAADAVSVHSEGTDSVYTLTDSDIDDTEAALNPRLITHELQHHNLWSDKISETDSSLDEEEAEEETKSMISTLNLAHNLFDEIPPGLPCLAPKLTRLNMSYNTISDMGASNMYPLTLRQLDLSHNNIKTWPNLAKMFSHCDVIGESGCCNPPASPAKQLPGSPIRTKLRSRSRSSARSTSRSRRTSGSSALSCNDAANLCKHRRHIRLENLRTLILANNELDRLVITIEGGDIGDDSSSLDSLDSSSSRKSSSKDSSSSPGTATRSKILFPQLTMLDVSNNRIKEIPANIHELSALSVVNVAGNVDITFLPPEMGLLNKLWNLNTRGCNLSEPLRSMVDSKKYKTMDLIGYLKSILEDSKPYARMKLMLVGVQGVGKTSLLEKLREEGTGTYKKKAPEGWAKRMGNININVKTTKGGNLSTVGVDVGDWTFEKSPQKVRLPLARSLSELGILVDREYYATHQYFLTKRSLYLIVWKISDGEAGVSEILHWLINIQARAPNSPVLIIGTHLDEVKDKKFPPTFSEDLQALIKEKFINVIDPDKLGLPRVLGTIEVSCKTRHNIKQLCQLIYDSVFDLRVTGSKERLLEQKIPATYLALEDVIGFLVEERRQKKKDPVLHAEQYRMLVMHEMMQRFGISFRDLAELNQATSFLHENGVLLHYEDATLKDLYFLDPQWLCDMLAHVVTIREINPFAKNGVMKTDDLKHVFKSSKCTSHDIKTYILNLLNKFEVALTWDNRTLLIPSLLPSEVQLNNQQAEVKIPVKGQRKTPLSKASTVVGQSGFFLPLDLPKPDASKGEAVSLESQDKSCFVAHRRNPALALRRLYLMSYFPSGFWSRLITRILADNSLVSMVTSAFAIPENLQEDGMLLSLLAVRAEWVCFQTGMELVYAGSTLIRMKEVLCNGIFNTCDYRQRKLLLQIEDHWSTVDVNSFSIMEICIPNDTLVVKTKTVKGDDHVVALDCNPSYAAHLMASTVDHIDTLLEDWYPTLGTRFVHTSEGKFLITRTIPCTQCLIEAEQTISMDADNWSLVSTEKSSEIVSIEGSVAVSGSKQKSSQESKSSPRRSLQDASSIRTDSCDTTSRRSTDSAEFLERLRRKHINAVEQYENFPEVYCFLVEECILASHQDKGVKCPKHDMLSLPKLAPDVCFIDLTDNVLIKPDQIKRGKLLGRGAFGFVFRGYVTKAIAITESTSVYLKGKKNRIDVAMKMLQPTDPGIGASSSALQGYKAALSKWQRDPVQSACKAYCTARQELRILQSLRHKHIVPLVGLCIKPLSLILSLAPQGSLDELLRDYRRSGARVRLPVLQRVVIQIAKALEYLHQHHIIYRDLKSENVLVWAFPPPNDNHFGPKVDVKLADYGISRSTLPSGTKGFGGTEGFMAPEIVKYNGEEEYTEKVDCFSFGMFMYELITLHLPFQGQEQVKDQILEGNRPQLQAQDTFYPSHVLDLMTLCWTQQPTDRPSASQVVSIATAPEFCHLQDVVSLEEQTSVTCAAAVEITEGEEEGLPPVLFAEVWLGRHGKQLDIVSCNQQAWLDYKTLPLEGMSVSCAIVVDDTVWIGDSKGVIYTFCSKTYQQLSKFIVTMDTAPDDSGIRCMLYLPDLHCVLVSQTNHQVSLCNAAASEVLLAFDGNNRPVFSMAALRLGRKRQSYELWLGQDKGSILSVSVSKQEMKILGSTCHWDQPPEVSADVQQLVTCINDNQSVWSYVYPGCIVYHWDIRNLTITNKIDCSKLAPVSESITSISIEEHISPGRCQVTAVAVLEQNIYIGTMWGCIIVAEKNSMRPITIFRIYEESVQTILPVRVEDSESIVPTESPRRLAKQTPVLVTVGKGYRELIGRYIPKQKRSEEEEMRKKCPYLITWQASHWSSH